MFRPWFAESLTSPTAYNYLLKERSDFNFVAVLRSFQLWGFSDNFLYVSERFVALGWFFLLPLGYYEQKIRFGEQGIPRQKTNTKLRKAQISTMTLRKQCSPITQ